MEDAIPKYFGKDRFKELDISSDPYKTLEAGQYIQGLLEKGGEDKHFIVINYLGNLVCTLKLNDQDLNHMLNFLKEGGYEQTTLQP